MEGVKSMLGVGECNGHGKVGKEEMLQGLDGRAQEKDGTI